MNTSSRSSSVYRNQNVLVRAVFERAGSARKVLCVALDYAKTKHVALICDGNGDILKAAFPVENTTAGVAHLIEQISATARRRKITKDCIYLGGEDEAPYVANFSAALRDKGYLVVRVNAYEAKESRENLLANAKKGPSPSKRALQRSSPYFRFRPCACDASRPLLSSRSPTTTWFRGSWTGSSS